LREGHEDGLRSTGALAAWFKKRRCDAVSFMRTGARGSPSWPREHLARPDTFAQTYQAIVKTLLQTGRAIRFERQPEMTDPRPQGADADLHRMIIGEPGLQLNQRNVGFLRHLCAQRLVIGPKLRLRPAARLVGRPIAGRATPAERLVDVRHADPK
jgi:hypothetical protein